MARRGLVWALTRVIMAALPRRSKSRKAAPKKVPFDQESFLAKMDTIAAGSDGSVQVLRPSGRRTRPNDLSIVPLDTPAALSSADPFISAKVDLDGNRYGFHAYAHPLADLSSPIWLYFVVTGPEQATLRSGEFHITSDFHWTGERPWNPLPVKTALRWWINTPLVQEAIATAKKKVPRGWYRKR